MLELKRPTSSCNHSSSILNRLCSSRVLDLIGKSSGFLKSTSNSWNLTNNLMKFMIRKLTKCSAKLSFKNYSSWTAPTSALHNLTLKFHPSTAWMNSSSTKSIMLASLSLEPSLLRTSLRSTKKHFTGLNFVQLRAVCQGTVTSKSQFNIKSWQMRIPIN